eukprot:scaffold68958_cov38-Phaeocystis_antarctica.AAC.1
MEGGGGGGRAAASAAARSTRPLAACEEGSMSNSDASFSKTRTCRSLGRSTCCISRPMRSTPSTVRMRSPT